MVTPLIAGTNLIEWATKSKLWEKASSDDRLQLYKNYESYRVVFLQLLAHTSKESWQVSSVARFFLSIHRIEPCSDKNCYGEDCCMSSPLQQQAWERLSTKFHLCQDLFNSLSAVTPRTFSQQKSPVLRLEWLRRYKAELLRLLTRVPDKRIRYKLYVQIPPNERGSMLDMHHNEVPAILDLLDLTHRSDKEPLIATSATIKTLSPWQQHCALGASCNSVKSKTSIIGKPESGVCGAYHCGEVITRWDPCGHTMCLDCSNKAFACPCEIKAESMAVDGEEKEDEDNTWRLVVDHGNLVSKPIH